MHPDAFPLARAERPALVPDRVGDAEPAKVVHETRAPQRAAPRPRAVRACARPRRRARRRRASGRAMYGDFRSTKLAIASSAASNRSPESDDRERGLGLDHRVPGVDRVETGEDRVRLCAQQRRPSLGRTACRCAPARARSRPRGRRRDGRPRRTPRAARAARRAGSASPLSPPGQPRPSQRSYAAPRLSLTPSGSPSRSASAARDARRAGRSCRRSRGARRPRTRARRGVDAAADCPRPAGARGDTTARRLRASWPYFVAFSAMSSPNHFACSCASEWQPTLTSSAV